MEKLHKIIELSLLDILYFFLNCLKSREEAYCQLEKCMYLKSVGEKINAMSKILNQHFPSTIILPPYHITYVIIQRSIIYISMYNESLYFFFQHLSKIIKKV